MGINKQMGIEVKGNAWVIKINDAVSFGSGINDIFNLKVKN